eukprot:14751480-Alexandrium_andersonii.AAC.1
MSLSKAWNPRNMGPLQLQLWAPGAPRETRPPLAQRQNLRVHVFRSVQALDKDVSPCGAC